MHVHLRHGFLHGGDDIDVSLARVLGMDAALHAHFRAAALPGFPRAALDLLVGEVVGPTAQVLGQLALGKRAELALEVADVGVVDVAVDDVADGVAVDLGPQRVGGLHDGVEVIAPGADEADDRVLLEIVSGARPGEDVRHVGRHVRRPALDALEGLFRRLHLFAGRPAVYPW